MPQWTQRPEGKAGLSWATAASLVASRPRPRGHRSWLGALGASFLGDILFSQILKPLLVDSLPTSLLLGTLHLFPFSIFKDVLVSWDMMMGFILLLSWVSITFPLIDLLLSSGKLTLSGPKIQDLFFLSLHKLCRIKIFSQIQYWVSVSKAERTMEARTVEVPKCVLCPGPQDGCK